MAANDSLTVGELDLLRRLERLPFGRAHWRLAFMGGLGLTFEGADNALVAFLLPPVTAVFALSNEQAGILGSSVMIGFLIGAFLAGSLGDVIGRRSVMMYALAAYATFTLIAAFSPNWEFLFWSRVLAGIGIGGEATIIAPFLSEFVQSRYRGRFIGAVSGFFGVGFLLAAILGFLVVPSHAEGWRIVQVIAFLPIFMLLWWRRSLPESPRWLMQQGRSDEAEKVVAKMEVEVLQGRKVDLPSLESVMVPRVAVRRGGSILQNLAALWSRNMAGKTAMAWVMWLSITFSYYGFFTWVPSLLVKMGMTITRSFGYSIIIYSAQIPGYYSAAFVAEKLDRKWTVILYMLGGSASAYLMSRAPDEGMITLTGFMMSFFMSGVYSALYIYTPEVYPTEFRTTGMGVASAVGRIGGLSAPIVIGFTYAQIGFSGVFSMTMAVLLIAALVVGVLGASTAGKTLEQIAAEETGDVTRIAQATRLPSQPPDLFEQCRAIFRTWSRQAPPSCRLTFGPDEAGSGDPAVRADRDRGAHFFWVATSVVPYRFSDAHVGVVLDPTTGSARAGFHVSRGSGTALDLAQRLQPTIAAFGLERRVSELVDELQWNGMIHDLAVEGSVAAVCGDADALFRAIQSLLSSDATSEKS